ncbi:MAG: hypothetical protein PHS14_08020 [Elusimicrobia bacterium]|nr:hypothetical protein [Elusimicrobiota bacterium]
MGSTVHITREASDSLRLVNTTGVALVRKEFTIMRGKGLVALEAIASLASGALQNVYACEFQAADFDTGEATFAAADLAVYWDPSSKKFSNVATVGHYLVGHSKAAIASGVLDVIGCDPILVVDSVATLASAVEAAEDDIDDLEAVAAIGGKPFIKTVSLAALSAGTAVAVLTEEEVGAGNKAFVTGFKATVGGGTAWSGGTGTKVVIQDTAASPIPGAEIAVAALTGNAVLSENSADVTLKAALANGFTTAKGVNLKADNNFGAGSALAVTIVGFIAPAA